MQKLLLIEKPKPIRKAAITDNAKLMEKGEKLWNNDKLGKSGVSCATCHSGDVPLKKEPFPKYIKMADDILTLDQMINFCMINPIKGKPLSWESQEMTALAAYVQRLPKEEGEAMHPCGMKHPCGKK
jgi:cytochrome c